MKTSTDRILTTHTGSLPRPPALRELLVQKDQGEPYDAAVLARLTREAVFAIVRRQAEAGVDVINDGEMSKPGYSTYVADRLTGLRRQRAGQAAARYRAASEFRRRLCRMTGDNAARRAVCVGPIAVHDRAAAARRYRQSARRAGAGEGGRGLHDRGLARPRPGVPDQPLLSDARSLCRGDRGGDAAGIRGDRRRRLRAAARLPRPRDGAPHPLPGSERSRFPEARRISCRGAEPRTAQRAGRDVPHPHLLGQLRGAARPRHRFRQGRADPDQGEADGAGLRGGQPAPRARMDGVARSEAARRQDPGARRARHLDQLCRASRTGRRAARAASPTSSAASG